MPLPYGCQSLADIHTDVNEMCDPSSTAALPVDWAQSVPRPYESRSICMTPPVIALPLFATDLRRPQTTESADKIPVYEEEWFSNTRTCFEPLCPGRVQHITVKLPRRTKYLTCEP